MKNWHIYIFISYLVLINYLNLFFSTLMLIVILLLKFKRISKTYYFLLPLVIIVYLFTNNFTNTSYRVVNVRENYSIASDLFGNKVVIYDNSSLDYYDEIEIIKYNQLASYPFNLTFDFQSYLIKNRVRKEVIEYRLINDNNLISSNFLINDFSNKIENLGINNLFFSSGITLRSLINLVTSLLILFVDKRNYNLVRLLLMSILYFFFPYLSSILIYLIYIFLSYFYKDKNERLLLLSIVLFVMDYSILFHPSFLFLYLLNFCSYLNLSDNFVNNKLVLMFICLLLFKEFNLFSIIFFSLFKILAVIMLLVCFIESMFGFSFKFFWNMITTFDYFLDYFVVTKELGIILIILILLVIAVKNYFIDKLKPLIVVFIRFCYLLNPSSELIFMDVGQNDCTFISLPFGSGNYLYDVGDNEFVNNVDRKIIPFLKNEGILWLDGVIISHDDLDHSGGVINLISDFPVVDIYHHSFVLDRRNFYFRGISEVEGLAKNNEDSLVLYLSFNNLNVLMLGDIGVNREISLVNDYNLNNIDVLKLAHHGSNTSSSEELLSETNPKLSIISCGKNNIYNHPSEEVIKRLKAFQLMSFDTSKDGFIRIINIFGINFFQTGSGKFGII